MTVRHFILLISCTLGFGAAGICQENPRLQSVTSGLVVPEAIPLTLLDAIQRGVRNNLAMLSGGTEERLATAERLKDLSELLPRVNSRLASTQQQINLAAFGFPGFAGVPPVIGPFALVDARGSLSQPVVDLKRVHDLRESSQIERAVGFGNQNTRELVVLTVMDLYFQSVTNASRVRAVDAQVARAQVLFDRATDLRNAGVAPGIDVLRAQVELQTQQQRLIQARNEFARAKLDLARAIGLPLAQDFVLSSDLPAGPFTSTPLAEMLENAYANRADAKAADARVRAAEEAVKSARAENLPVVLFDADYGVIGRRPTSAHGTYAIVGSIRFPIFNSDAKGDTAEMEARLEARRIERDSLHGHIEHDVRSALLELQSNEAQLQVAMSALDLARQQLDQAQDRFVAGVASNLEVVQAQEALALADENVISSLYGLNVARAALARAAGTAEQSAQDFFGGNTRQ